ncbi:Uncharacterized protein SCP_0408210 [Sparassis crispa]|uniref:Solute carrier family 35 member F6 n=1 Tax=Sparassis crispa TaxID=139825 RepID=A0A401GJT7_9APHY|nr:Uncharacterized protein SCP_0408210 [Sparassis crispa]GBE82437.1 Uncharacterized protein SCP_0408210 [Sparassis crispa]
MPNRTALVSALLLLGSLTALAGKWQDMLCVANCSDPNIAHHELYRQPVWQTLQMFFGEMLCFLPFAYVCCTTRRPRSPPSGEASPAARGGAQSTPPLHGCHFLLLWLPAACDLSGTTLMYVGLLYTPVSVYQMSRAALVLFVAVFSVLFLHRKLAPYQWVALVTVMAGVALVGLCSAIQQPVLAASPPMRPQSPAVPLEHKDTALGITHSLLGVFFILGAQVFTAAQFVIEEKLLSRYAAPGLAVVAFEGLFGFTTVLLLTPLLASYAAAAPELDLALGWRQLTQTRAVLLSGALTACAMALVNWCGISVTRYVGATARSLADTARTLVIWLVSLALGWEAFVWPVSLLQLAGFALLVYGTVSRFFLVRSVVALFYDFVPPPAFLRPPHAHSPKIALATLARHVHADEDESAAPLLAEPEPEDAEAEPTHVPVDRGESGFEAPLHGRAHEYGDASV